MGTLIQPYRFVTGGGSGGSASYWTAVLADSPWAAWKTDELSGTSLADSSGNGRTSTITGTGSVTLAQTGPDGVTNDAVTWPASTLAGIGPNTPVSSFVITNECWVNVPSGGITAITPLMAVTNGGNSTNFVLYFDATGKINGRVLTGGASEVITAASAMAAGWHHVVHSVGSAGQKVRVDKVSVATGVKTSVDANSSAKLQIRGHGTFAGSNGDGTVKLARCSTWVGTQLTDTQTDAHYNAA